jgi:hypothetical protein
MIFPDLRPKHYADDTGQYHLESYCPTNQQMAQRNATFKANGYVSDVSDQDSDAVQFQLGCGAQAVGLA